MRSPAAAAWSMAAAALTLGASVVVMRSLTDAVDVLLAIAFWIAGSMFIVALLLIPIGITRLWSPSTIALYSSALIVGAAWLPAAVYLGPFNGFTGGWWTIGTVTATMLAIIAPGPVEFRVDIPVGERMSGRAIQWRRRLVEIGRVDPDTVKVKDWDVGDGYDVSGRFAPGGSHWQQLIAKKAELEADADLPKEGNMEFAGGATKRDYLIRVSIGANLDEPIPYPKALIKPRSIYDKHQHGIYQNSQPIIFKQARQNSAAVMAANGSGKSGTMHCWIAGYVMCIDCLTIVIDVKGGGELGHPWIRPWQEARMRGENPRPPLEAFATTGDQAKIVINFLRDLALNRPLWYADEKYQANSTDIPLSAKIPGFRVIIDEPKLLFAERPDIRDDFVELQEITRSVGMRFDYSLLGGTASYLPLPIQDQIKHHVVLEVKDKNDVGHFMDWQAAQVIDLDLLRDNPGMGFVKDADHIPRLGRYFQLRPQNEIRDIALAASEIRPDVDARATELPSWEAYSRRWDWHDPTIPQEATVTASNSGRELYPDEKPYTPMVSREQSRSDMADITARLNAYTGDTRQAEPSFADIVADFKADPIRDAVSEYLAEHGESATGDIINYLTAPAPEGKGVQLTRQRLNEKLTEMANAGHIDKVRQGFYKL